MYSFHYIGIVGHALFRVTSDAQGFPPGPLFPCYLPEHENMCSLFSYLVIDFSIVKNKKLISKL